MIKRSFIIAIILIFFFSCDRQIDADDDTPVNQKPLFIIGVFPGEIGYIDSDGKIVIPKKYKHGGGDGEFHEGLVDIKGENGKEGYIDIFGKIVIEPIYDRAKAFSGGLAAVEKNGKEGYIDKKGNAVIDLKYRLVYDFSEGLAFVLTFDLKRFIINKKGEVVAEVQGENAGGPITGFINGFAIMRKQDPVVKSEYIDAYIGTDGKFLTEFRYADAAPFTKEGYAAALDIRIFRRVLIDRTGKMAFPQLGEYNVLGVFEDGFCAAAVGPLKSAQWGIIDKNGKWVVEAQYGSMSEIKNGLAWVQLERGGKWGVINTKGEMVVKPQFTAIMPFSDGMALVSFEGYRAASAKDPASKWGYINTKGELVIEPKYRINPQDLESCNFRNGLAKIGNEYINKQGKVVYSD
jgi:hypothetical protein